LYSTGISGGPELPPKPTRQRSPTPARFRPVEAAAGPRSARAGGPSLRLDRQAPFFGSVRIEVRASSPMRMIRVPGSVQKAL
jgi:hypothetical protein